MGFLSSVIRFFFCVDDEDQPSEEDPILVPTAHDAPLSQRLLISSPSSESCSDRSRYGVLIPPTCLHIHRDSIATDALYHQNVSEFQKCLDYHSDSSSSDSRQQEVLIPSAGILPLKDLDLQCTFQEDLVVPVLQRSQDSATWVNNLEFLEAKKHDVCSPEELRSQEPIEKKQDAYFLQELHSREPIESRQNEDARFLEELYTKVSIEKKPDACLLEELHFKEPIERKKYVYMLEDLRSEEPIEDVEEREEEVTKAVVAEERWINHYSSLQKILLVGEGDFSFSASLANAFGSARNMIATSLDSREFLSENYGRAISNIENLTRKGCSVIHGVDAKKMANHQLLKGMTFDRIVYNFPFAGFFKTESREFQLRRHRRLVSLFLKNAKEMINKRGEIHITHKTNAFHSEWNIEELASCHGLRLIEAVRFHNSYYPGYRTKCGFGGNNDFNCNPSKTYKFGLRNASTKRKKKKD